jgi:hypothetical protein
MARHPSGFAGKSGQLTVGQDRMTLKVHSRECRLHVVSRKIQRRQTPRHHIDLAQLSHFETGVW